ACRTCATTCTFTLARASWPACRSSIAWPNCRTWPRLEWILICPISNVLDKAVAGERLTPAEGLSLLESHDLVRLGQAADAVTRRLHPEPFRTYNIDRNINYTNVCSAVCDFCAFYRTPKHPEGYVLDRDTILQKIQETVDLGGDQI